MNEKEENEQHYYKKLQTRNIQEIKNHKTKPSITPSIPVELQSFQLRR